MKSHIVRVTSRRYDAGIDQTYTLEFSSGVALRPILRPASHQEMLFDGGTRIAIKLNVNPKEANGILNVYNTIKSLDRIVAKICPSLDVCVVVEEDGVETTAIDANDWLDIDGMKLFSRISGNDFTNATHPYMNDIKLFSSHLRQLKDDKGHVYGRACIAKSALLSDIGTLTIGGLKSCGIKIFGGIIVGGPTGASRNSGVPYVPKNVLKLWAQEQANLILKSSLSEYGKRMLVAALYRCGANIDDFSFISNCSDELMTLKDFVEAVSKLDEILVCHDDDMSHQSWDENVSLRDFEVNFVPEANLFLIPKPLNSLLQGSDWPVEGEILEFYDFVTELLLVSVHKAWGEDPESNEEWLPIGEVNGEVVEREVVVFKKANT